MDDKTWRFDLRKGVKFHNGETFSADSVKFSLERAIDTTIKSQVFAALNTIDKVEMVDPYTVVIKTKESDPLLPARLSYYGGQMLPSEYYKKVGMDGFRAKPIGTGCVKFADWKKNERLVLERNSNYWRGPIQWDRIIVKPYPETATRTSVAATGEADIATLIPPDQVEFVEKAGTTKVLGALYCGFFLYVINTNTPPLDNKLVRQAINYAVDRQGVVKNLWRGYGAVPNDAYPNTDKIGYTPGKTPLQYDPQKAKELLKKGGYKGEEILVSAPIGYITNDKQLTEVIASMLQEVGINAKVNLMEYSVRAQKQREKNIGHSIWLGNPTSYLFDPDAMEWRLMQPGGIFSYWRNPEWDDLMSKARINQDVKKRDEMYKKAATIFMEEVPWLIIIQPEQLFAVKKTIKWKPRSDELIQFYEVLPQ
jgi:peptide/nickel transport system substrate-binding protein